jgi:hypothetical protein
VHFLPSRRSLLQGAGAIAGGLFFSGRADAATHAVVPGSVALPAYATAQWVLAENRHLGDGGWLHGHLAEDGTLEAYASTTSATLGERVKFFVSTTSPTLTAKVYRMGYYQGFGARRVATKTNIQGSVHPMPAADQYGTVDCHWPTTFTLTIDSSYPPGQYLVRLENTHGQYRFVPLLVRDDNSAATYVYLSAVTTWQAYNTWGGYSLYHETNSLGTTVTSNVNRAVRVSFNRPYDVKFANGAADFIGNEFPLLFLAERMGLDMTYWTDIDLDERGDQLTRHKVLMSPGHDEYYSPKMRDATTTAIKEGVNVAFFGANFSYRKIRFEPGVNGSRRLMVNYRSTADPITVANPTLATVNWSQYPSNQPESAFSGSIYGGADGYGSMVVEDASTWLWRGTGLHDGSVLLDALGGEFNRYNPQGQNPSNVQIFGHSPVGGGVGDITYVAERGQGGVFCSGTGYWIYRLSNSPRMRGGWVPHAVPGVTQPITVATQNVLALFARGPAGNDMPSVDNTRSFY